MDVVSSSVEAFLDLGCGKSSPLTSSSYSAGYRLVETGEVICVVKLPVSIAESAILRRSSLSITVTPTGDIEVSAGGLGTHEQIDDLLARTVSRANLDMEEATTSDLQCLLRRLERSVSLVKEAIARMPRAP